MRFLLACLGLALSLAAPAIAKTYSNELFGITIERPDNWHTISVAEASANAREKVEIDTPEFDSAVGEFQNAALFVFMKYPITHPGIIPTLKLTVHSAQGLDGASDVQIVGLMTREMGAMFQDFEVVEAPTEVTIGTTKAARFTVRFGLPAHGKVYRITSRAWVIKRGRYFINLATSFEKDADGEELARIANTFAQRQ